MKKLIFVAASALIARENPFLEAVKIEHPSAIEQQSEFSKIAFSFPKDARKINRLQLEYLAVDGSIKNYFIDIDQPIDWHKVYMMLSEDELLRRGDEQGKSARKVASSEAEAAASADAAESAAASKEIIAPNLEIAAPNLETTSVKSIDIKASRAPQPKVQEQAAQELKIKESKEQESIKLGKNLTFVIKKDSVRVNSSAKLIRQFALNQPDRIVMDFERVKGVKGHTFPLINSSFDVLVIGVHKDFLRIVLHTDSKYDYDISYDQLGCKVKLK